MTLKIAEWNANGLCRHAQEIQTFIQNLDLDILLVSETHFTDRSYIKIPNYHVYCTNHPDGTAHGGSAIIIKHSTKHHERAKYSLYNIQATSVTIEDKHRKTNHRSNILPAQIQ
jgi:exonuclease III